VLESTLSQNSGRRKCYCVYFNCCIYVKVFINTLERSAQNVFCIAAVVNVRTSNGFQHCKKYVRPACVIWSRVLGTVVLGTVVL